MLLNSVDEGRSEWAPRSEYKGHKYKEVSEDGRLISPHNHSIAVMSANCDGISAIGPNRFAEESCYDKLSNIEIE